MNKEWELDDVIVTKETPACCYTDDGPPFPSYSQYRVNRVVSQLRNPPGGDDSSAKGRRLDVL